MSSQLSSSKNTVIKGFITLELLFYSVALMLISLIVLNSLQSLLLLQRKIHTKISLFNSAELALNIIQHRLQAKECPTFKLQEVRYEPLDKLHWALYQCTRGRCVEMVENIARFALQEQDFNKEQNTQLVRIIICAALQPIDCNYPHASIHLRADVMRIKRCPL